jgi:hypothetical protein
MRKRLARAALVTAAAAAAIVLTATNALAGPTSWTVTHSGAYTESILAGTHAVLTDTTASQSITCSAESGSGTLNGTAMGSPAVLATVTASSFTTCTDSLGDSGWSATGSGTWSLNGDHFGVTDGTCGATGVTCGTVSNITATVTGKILGAACSFKVSGTVGTDTEPGVNAANVPVSYTNTNGHLVVSNTKTLTITNVVGCSGIIKNNDVSEFTGTFVVSTSGGTPQVTGTPAS